MSRLGVVASSVVKSRMASEVCEVRDDETASLRRTALKLARVAAAVLFGGAALMKLLGFAAFVNLFGGDGLYSPPMRYAVGSVELAGAILVARGRSALAGALLLFAATLFAIVHVLSIGRSPLPLSVLIALTGGLIVVEGRRKQAGAGSG